MFIFNNQTNLSIDFECFVFKHVFCQDFNQYFQQLPKREVEAIRIEAENFEAYNSRIISDGIELELDQRNTAVKADALLMNWTFSIPANPIQLTYEKLYKLFDNYIIVIPPQTECSVFQPPFANRLNVHISTDKLNNFFEALHLPEPHILFGLSKHTSKVFHCSAENLNALRQLCFELYQMAFNLISQSRISKQSRLEICFIKQQLEDEIIKYILLSLAEVVEIKPKKILVKRSSVLKNTEEFMVHNIKSDIATKDICNELKVSQRNLEYIFKDFYGIPPQNYFKRLRLNALKKELQLRSKKMNITAIAHEYGFFHRGRLAADYQKLFGELPSDTLRN